MRTLIVTAHPDPQSLTHAVAAQIAAGLRTAGHANVTMADLSAEGFDPRFSQDDLAAHHRRAPSPTDVLQEQARLDGADALVLVFPVYWWAMPALLKGWIDRVFSNGWAYDDGGANGVVKKLGHLDVHLVALGGADDRTWQRRGYRAAMKTQIETGIFDYCGAPVVSSTLLLEVDSTDPAPLLAQALQIGQQLRRAERPSADPA